jgi:hypothetical protein
LCTPGCTQQSAIMLGGLKAGVDADVGALGGVLAGEHGVLLGGPPVPARGERRAIAVKRPLLPDGRGHLQPHQEALEGRGPPGPAPTPSTISTSGGSSTTGSAHSPATQS